MSTICADELLHDSGELHEDRAARQAPARHLPALAAQAEAGRAGTPATRRRFEDFEQRTSRLGDLLGGQVFPRVF